MTTSFRGVLLYNAHYKLPLRLQHASRLRLLHHGLVWYNLDQPGWKEYKLVVLH